MNVKLRVYYYTQLLLVTFLMRLVHADHVQLTRIISERSFVITPAHQ